jgi:predicted RNA-binding Zn ribbon-like protein
MTPLARDLPLDLELPLRTGAPWWYWLGGRPAMDLVNSLRERWQRRVETLVTPDDLTGWLLQAGLLESPAPATPHLLEDARRLREAIDACVEAALAQGPVDARAVAEIDRLLADATAHPRLLLDAAGLPVLEHRAATDPVRAALGAIALDAAELLGDPAQRARLRICGSASCSARFYDRSPAGARRWCTMRTCGNAAKARRHRARASS